MSAKKNRRHALIRVVAMLAFVLPLPAGAQQLTSSLQDHSAETNSFAPAATAAQSMPSPSPNPFQRPGTAVHKTADDTDVPDALLYLMNRTWIATSAAYAFSAPPSFYAPQHNAFDPAIWSSSMSGAVSASLRRSGTASLRMSGDLENYGQRRQAGTSGDPGAQTFTMDWELAQLLPTRLGFLEVAAGRYQQQVISNRAFANGPLTDVLMGYSASSVGFETSFTLPDKNIGLTVRYGTERVGFEAGKSHTTMFEFTWTW